MISKAVVEALAKYVPEENLFLLEPMSAHTTFKVGGAADCLVEIQNTQQLSKLQSYLSKVEVPYYVLGNGSNLLVSDEGFRGVILKVGDGMSEISVLGNRVIAQAGAKLARVARVAAEHGLTGLEFASGIPGTVGGGVVMNAGAYDGEMSQVVKTVTVIGRDGELLKLDNATMEFGYRKSTIKNQPFVVTEVVFELSRGDKDAIRAKMEELNGKRREKQPLEYPSAGSTFKRPEGHFAGELIMKAGLRGYQVGGAQVSEKHCGFVINKDNATAADVMKLIEKVQEQVYEQFEVHLEPEVIFLGKF